MPRAAFARIGAGHRRAARSGSPDRAEAGRLGATTFLASRAWRWRWDWSGNERRDRNDRRSCRGSIGPAAVARPGDGACAMQRSSRLAALAEQHLPRRPRAHGQFLQEGLHPPDAAVPGRLPLLHLRQGAARGRAALPLARRRPRHCPCRAAAGCKEALFTLGDQPELRYAAARDALRALGAEFDAGLSGVLRGAGAARDRPAAASQPRRHGREAGCGA